MCVCVCVCVCVCIFLNKNLPFESLKNMVSRNNLKYFNLTTEGRGWLGYATSTEQQLFR